LKLLNIPENSLLIKLREECFGEVGSNFMIQILNLGVLLSVELARRLENKNNNDGFFD
jgi:hypothetical protein